jgi:hypothetical protein
MKEKTTTPAGLKIGYKVKLLPKHYGSFDYDVSETYTINEIGSNGRDIHIVDSKGNDRSWWDDDKFELVSSEPDYMKQFKAATKLIGKKVSYVNGSFAHIKVKNVVLVSKESTSNKSDLVHDYLKTHEFCVVCTDSGVCVPFESVTPLGEYKELKISDEYTAKVYEDKVVVGCQTIPLDTVKELIKLAENI